MKFILDLCTWKVTTDSDDRNREREHDIFKHTLIRYFGYANEVGESFRALIHVNWVRLSYLTASGYVVADSIHKGYLTSQKSFNSPHEKRTQVSVSVGDTLVWQGLASVAIPGLTINRICALSNILLKKTSSLPCSVRKWTTTGIGLVCIPFIISPIDRSVDHLMDKVIRPYYPVSSDPHSNHEDSESGS
ncbi:mitochondrial fission process protein 1-like [Haliotis rufescens]|uniref:mitochondrial fission process protein 1-like n=1 Tax=Haliotis rufescens TaxID=6454 RepID=UPI00201EF91C|nr:mitochondrial fission process protein 1-like [Haliotis rufescens]